MFTFQIKMFLKLLILSSMLCCVLIHTATSFPRDEVIQIHINVTIPSANPVVSTKIIKKTFTNFPKNNIFPE